MRLPSVTQIISNLGLTADLGFLDGVYRHRGTAVHGGAELIIKGKTPALAPLEHPWSENQKYVKCHSEIPMFWKAISQAKEDLNIAGELYECRFNTAWYTGQLDLAGYIDNAPCFIDWKSGSSYAPMTALQLAAYQDLAIHGKPINPNQPGLNWLEDTLSSGQMIKRRGIQIRKEGKYKIHSYTSINEPYDDSIWIERWRAALCLYNSVPDHRYLVEEKERSRLRDLHWCEWKIKKSMGGKAKELAIAAGKTIYNLRLKYNLF